MCFIVWRYWFGDKKDIIRPEKVLPQQLPELLFLQTRGPVSSHSTKIGRLNKNTK